MRKQIHRDSILAAAVPVTNPVRPLADDDDAAERAHRRRTLAGLDGLDDSQAAFLGLPIATSLSGHGHADSGEGEIYEPYAGYGPRPLISALATGVPADYVPARAHSTSPRPASPGYAALPIVRNASSSVGHSGGSSSGHDHSSSHGHTWIQPHPYSAGRPRTPPPPFDSPPTSDQQHEPLMAADNPPPPVPSRHPSRPGMKIQLPPPPVLLSTESSEGSHSVAQPYATANSEFPPSSYSLYPPSDDGRLDPNLAQRLRGGAMTSASTQSFRDDQDYSRRVAMIRQNTYDSYASVPSNIPESEDGAQ